MRFTKEKCRVLPWGEQAQDVLGAPSWGAAWWRRPSGTWLWMALPEQGLDQEPSRGPFQPQAVCDAVEQPGVVHPSVGMQKVSPGGCHGGCLGCLLAPSPSQAVLHCAVLFCYFSLLIWGNS